MKKILRLVEVNEVLINRAAAVGYWKTVGYELIHDC